MTLFNKKLTTLALAAILALGMAGAAQAAGRDYRPDAQAYQAYPGLSTEQQAKAKKIHDETVAATSETREKLRAKRAELDAQLASPEPDKDKIESLSREIGELRGKLMAARVDLRAKLAKEGIPAEAYEAAPGPRNGFGPGNGGPANAGPGYGPAPCWGPNGGYGYGYHHGRRGGHHRGGWGGNWGGGYAPQGGCGCW
ncbi:MULTISPECIES: periplasmic heavy metal sensor [unclassified Desulfovibrio]|uniref:periplasmic heavy metal sensor n=1 Tax=unclassified Desulfovibrio TaxID=2593640 RepID=UPI0013EC0734|nr:MULTISPECIES: periplasmic heavy metal sensor [unclassified Desulfovibrio]